MNFRSFAISAADRRYIFNPGWVGAFSKIRIRMLAHPAPFNGASLYFANNTSRRSVSICIIDSVFSGALQHSWRH